MSWVWRDWATPPQKGEIVLVDDLESFGDGWDDATAEDVFDFIEQFCEPQYHEFSVYMESGNHDVHRDVVWVSVRETFCSTKEIDLPFHAGEIMEAIHDQVGIGQLHYSGKNSWIWLEREHDDLHAYEGPFELAITSSVVPNKLISVIE